MWGKVYLGFGHIASGSLVETSLTVRERRQDTLCTPETLLRREIDYFSRDFFWGERVTYKHKLFKRFYF